MKDDDLLRDAFRAVRDEHVGDHPEPDATLRAALLRTRRTRRQSAVRFVLLPAAAVLLVGTAFAGVTGRLTPALRSLDLLSTPDDPVVTPAPAPGPGPAPAPAPAPDPDPDPDPEPQTPAPTAIAIPPAIPPPPAATPTPPVPPPTPTPTDPHASLFAEAHTLHFVTRDPTRALAAWDRYLAVAPDGRFALEARYNRALTLVRLGRNADASSALAPFAAGAFGGYRRDEAQKLLDALSHDE